MILHYDQQPLIEATDAADEGILDGRAVAAAMREQLASIAAELSERGIEPSLHVVQVGQQEASTIYVKHKIRACNEIGIRASHHRLPEEITEPRLHRRLEDLSADEDVNGILLQLPLPAHIDDTAITRRMDPTKDVDGFHPVNLGCLMTRRSLLEPCTPTGILTLLSAAGIDPQGKEAVVIGRSVIVGRPTAMMLTRADATVTICHRHTADLEQAVRRAELLVVATGVAELVPGEWIRPGAVVVDVGISRKDGQLTGDVQFESARKRARWITPVPGGVGPMTVATVLENTLRATCMQHGLVVRDGQLLSAGEAGLRFESVQGLKLMRLHQ